MNLKSKKTLWELRRRFQRRFGPGGAEGAAISPGRVNLIGEHTDYNGGLVLPIAVDRHTAVAFRSDPSSRRITVHAERFIAGGDDEFDTQRAPRPEKDSRRQWVNYVRGAAAVLMRRGVRLRGGQLYIGGDLPPGGGLSSSAALSSAAALAFCAMSKHSAPPRLDLAKACQEVEHKFAGVRCGLMDPTAILCARPGCALLLDCDCGRMVQIPIRLPGWSFAVFDTGVRHSLAAGEYNRRRAECEAAARTLGVKYVSNISAQDILLYGGGLTTSQQKRIRHVTGENLRVAQFAAALKRGAADELGRLLSLSHVSLRDEYEVSCPELDFLQHALTTNLKGRSALAAGARMMGGGFGGSVVALIKTGSFKRVSEVVSQAYRRKFGRSAPGLLLNPGPGAELVKL